MFLTLSRIVKFGFQDVWRNFWLSLATIMILILTLFSVNLLLSLRIIGQAAVDNLKNRVDISIYLKEGVSEDKALGLKARLANLDNVQEVSYVSQADALEAFRRQHQDNPEILQALQELDKNPLTSSLTIKPRDPDQYNQLIEQLSQIQDPLIGSRNFQDNQALLAKINNITNKINDIAIVISSIFVLIMLLVIFNSVKLAIHSHRQEIAIMKLVGASNFFIKAPFLFSSIIYTVAGVILTAAIFYLFLNVLQPYLDTFFFGYNIDLLQYFNHYWWQIAGLQLLGIGTVNLLASYIAVGKYSRI
ncbi:MAG TPA: permease-like cell division protein FtsX [bacterium]|nr:permease-like cell division protein FtsX [bacterium]